MPIYTLQGPDGKVYKIEGPAGATAEQLSSFITSTTDASAKDQRRAEQLQKDRETYAPTVGMSTTDKLLAGAGKAFADIGRGVGQMVGATDRKDVEESRKLDSSLMATGAGQIGNLAGNVAIAAPTAFIPGANTIAGSAAIGAGMGLLQPSTSTNETLKNVGFGGAAGAAVPAAIRAGQVAKAAIDPFYKAGQNKIVGTALNEATGGDAAATIQRLNAAGPLVSGSFPTAGQAGGNPGLAAMERTATATDPVAMNQIAQRLKDQNAARVAALQGAPPDRASAMAARTAATEPLYRQAYGETISMTPGLSGLMDRPSMQGAMSRGQALAREQGQQLSMTSGKPGGMSSVVGPDGVPTLATTPATPATMTGRDAHLMKMGLDDMANASPMSGIGGNELRAIQGTRGEFLGEIEKQVPSYGQARQTYADMSRPINQADVVEEMSRAINHRGDITPAAYARALRDETAQRATGQPNATLSKVFEPDQLKSLTAIKDDLGRADFAQTAGRGVGSDTVQKLAYSNLMAKSGLPNWAKDIPGVGIVGRMADLGYKRSNDEMRQKLAQALLDPKETAAMMEAGMVTPQMQALIENLNRGGAALGASAPALVQANQK